MFARPNSKQSHAVIANISNCRKCGNTGSSHTNRREIFAQRSYSEHVKLLQMRHHRFIPTGIRLADQITCGSFVASVWESVFCVPATASMRKTCKCINCNGTNQEWILHGSRSDWITSDWLRRQKTKDSHINWSCGALCAGLQTAQRVCVTGCDTRAGCGAAMSFKQTR
jgi:hypothetical protein